MSDGGFDSAPATVLIDVVVPPDPPDLLFVLADCGGTKVQATFDEPLDLATAADVLNYTISDAQGNPQLVVFASLLSDQQTVRLELFPPLSPGVSYTLTVASMCDPQGDCSAEGSPTTPYRILP